MVLGAPVFCYAQGEGNIWHFGHNAGIDFNSGNPVAIWSPVWTQEGVASICDSSGNLLFSTDGVTIYNSNGSIICTGLFGSSTATQSATIVPFPGSNHMYYIFTTPAFSSSIGICYSVVDMNLNGGLGGIVSINTQLLDSACEKLTVVRNNNGIDFWVVAHKNYSNEFYAFPVTSWGIGIPTITAIGLAVNFNTGSTGYLSCSPNGQKLATARNYPSSDPIELFDFDGSNGILSNYISIPNSTTAYGVCFSPDNSKLYIAYNEAAGINLQQYDLNIPNFQNFPYLLLQGTGVYHYALQLAPNGKIYCSKYAQNTLGVINNPNLAGVACNYNDNGFTLQSGTIATIGLPNFINNYYAPHNCSVYLGNDILLCGNNVSAILNVGTGFTNYTWNTGSTSQSIVLADSGTYSVIVMDSMGCVARDTIIITNSPDLNYTINYMIYYLYCADTGTGVIDINFFGGSGSYAYSWSNGATTQDINNLNAGTYTVTVTDSLGCVYSPPAFTIVQINDLQVSNISFNNLKCHDDFNGFINETVLNGLSPNNYEWSNGATTEDLNNLTAGSYSVTVSDAGGCTASDTVVITAPNQVIASLTTAADTVFCSVTGGSPSYHYLWSTGATTAFITSATNGTYSVTVSDINNCTALATLSIDAVSPIVGDTNFEIYPNPANGQLIIDNGQWIISGIQINDVLGRRVQSFEFKVQSPAAINVSDLSEGVYFIKLVSSSGTTVVKKFVVMH